MYVYIYTHLQNYILKIKIKERILISDIIDLFLKIKYIHKPINLLIK